LGQIELRPDFDRELERHRPILGNLDRLQIEFRLADGREMLFFADLLQAIEQQRALDLVCDLISKTTFDDFARRSAGAEAGHGRRWHHLAEGVIEVAINVVARDRYRHVPLAGAGAGDLDGKIERLVLLRLIVLALGLGRHAGSASSGGNLVVVISVGGHCVLVLLNEAKGPRPEDLPKRGPL
jgi:hypothetical protein